MQFCSSGSNAFKRPHPSRGAAVLLQIFLDEWKQRTLIEPAVILETCGALTNEPFSQYLAPAARRVSSH